jgi:hypothetical protein
MYQKTENKLKLIIQLLEEDQNNWSQFFIKALDAFEKGDYTRCAQIILSGSGGMGSLNDLVLGQTKDAAGNFQWKPDYQETNNKFQELLNNLYAFAHGINRAANKALKQGRA